MKLKKSVALRRFFCFQGEGRAATLNSGLLCKFARLHGKEALILSLPTLACRSGDCPKTADIVFAIRPTAEIRLKDGAAILSTEDHCPMDCATVPKTARPYPKGEVNRNIGRFVPWLQRRVFLCALVLFFAMLFTIFALCSKMLSCKYPFIHMKKPKICNARACG